MIPTTRIQRVTDQSSSRLGDETIVVHYGKGQYFELDEVGSYIWALLDEKTTCSLGEINQKIIDTFEVDELVSQSDLIGFLEVLLHEKLIKITA